MLINKLNTASMWVKMDRSDSQNVNMSPDDWPGAGNTVVRQCVLKNLTIRQKHQVLSECKSMFLPWDI